MKVSKRAYFTLNIVLMAAVMFVMSFIPENYPESFGDYLCPSSKGFGYHTPHSEPVVHWGFRHHVWMWTGIVLLVANIIFLAMKLDEWKEDSNG